MAVQGEVFREVFHEVFGLVLLGHSEQKIFSENFRPEFPWLCTAKLEKFQGKLHDEVLQGDPCQVLSLLKKKTDVVPLLRPCRSFWVLTVSSTQALGTSYSQRAPNTPEFAQPRLSRLKARERQRGGAKKRGGAKPHEETPRGKQFPTPLTSARFAPPPIPFLLVSPLEMPRISLSWPPQKPFSEGLEKWFPTGHPREVLLFGTFCPPLLN